jgi:hypothetical protein
MQLSQKRAEQSQKAKRLQDLMELQEQESIQKMQLIKIKEDYERNKNFHSAKLRSEQRAQKLFTYQNSSTQHEKESNEKIEVIKAKEEYERQKHLQEERDKLYQLKLETDTIKYNPNELQIAVFRSELEKVNKEQAAIEHEKLRNSMIRKANDDLLRDIVNSRKNAAKILSSQELEQMQQDINATQQNLQEIYYQNARNELL